MKKNIKLIDMLNENLIREASGIQNAETLLNPLLKRTTRDVSIIQNLVSKIPGGFKNTDGVAIKTVDDLVKSLESGKVSKGPLEQISKGLLRDPNTSQVLRTNLINDLIKDAGFISKYSGKSKDEIVSGLISAKNPYPKNIADEIASLFTKESPKIKTGTKTGGSAVKQKGKYNINIVGDNNSVVFTLNKNSDVLKTAKTEKGAVEQVADNVNSGVVVDTAGEVVPTTKEGIIKRLKGSLRKIILNKRVLKVAGAVGGLSGIYYFYHMYYSGENLLFTDESGNIPQEVGSFPPCVRDLIKNKGGQVLTDNSGTYIFVKDNEFTAGVKFYSNGRVADVKTKKMGTYKCKGEQVALQEQSSEIDVDTLTSYVNTAIDDLDGYVGLDNLNSLENIVRSLLGKTFEGKNALSEFNYLYKENEDEDFYQTISNVGVKTLDPKAVLVKRNILGLLSGKISSTTQTSTQKIGDTINITWDEKTNNTNTNTNTRTKVKYEDKSDFPFPRGTRNEKIREVQIALGFPQKYQTGNFGPITYRGIVSFIQNPESYKYGLTGGWSAYIEELKTKGLTKDLYDIIMRFGKKIEVSADGQTTGGTTQPQGQTTGGETSPVGTQTTGSDVTTNTTSPDRTPATTDETPSQLFNRFVKEGTIKGRLGGKRIVYKGPDLTDGDKEKLVSQLNSMGFRISDDKLEYRKGDKIIFKRGLEQE